VIPILTAEEMAAVDADAEEPVEILIERAGGAVARQALRMLGGSYGRRVVVVAGKGNNGADGRAAARRLERRGAKVVTLDAADAPRVLPGCDLVIDAAYGTGFRGEYLPPCVPGGAKVLAVDIPSGLDPVSGAVSRGGSAGEIPLVVRADVTVTFAAMKPGLLIGEGPEYAGRVVVADIGLDAGRARAQLVERDDARQLAPRRGRTANKWTSAVYVLAGSPGMYGAALLAAQAAMRAGAGMVRLGIPGADPATLPPTEVVIRPTPAVGFGPTVFEDMHRCRALVVGPGLGLDDRKASEIRRIIADAPVPVVVDADALTMLGTKPDLSRRIHDTVFTPHDGEFARLAGAPPGPDRFADVRALAAATRASVLLKGPTTIVAEPDGMAFAANTGGARLATAGTGDVLAGVIGAFLAIGLPGPLAAAIGAYVHGAAAELGSATGLVAGDLLDLLPRWLSDA
jgi:NAD(P)H-hydrate epimerase